MVASNIYSLAAARVLASAPNKQAPLWGITLSHSLFVAGNGAGASGETEHWLINRPASMALTLEDDTLQTYAPSFFELALPKMDGSGQQDMQLALQNVDRVIIDELELAAADPSERIAITLRLFLEDDPAAGPQNVPLELSFSSVQATPQVVTGIAGRPDVLNRPFPLEVYRIDRWPGLDR